MQPRRRLPVLPSGGEPGEPPRPPWQWVGFGALAIVAVWLPLAWLAAVVVGRAGLGPLGGTLAFAASLALAAIAGGYLLGRWGTRGVGVRQAALAGVAAALAATALAWVAAGVSPAALLTVALAAPPAALGARLGLKRRAGAW